MWVNKPGLVNFSDFFANMPISIGGTFPEAFPNKIIIPKLFRQSKDLKKVVFPTESITTGTPWPLVIFITESTKSEEL